MSTQKPKKSTKPPKHVIKNKRHQKHRPQVDKHFIATGFQEPVRHYGTPKDRQKAFAERKTEPIDPRYRKRTIESNEYRYIEEEEEILDTPEAIEDRKQEAYEALMRQIQDSSTASSYYKKPWEKEWDTKALSELTKGETGATFAINPVQLGKELRLLSVQERLRLDPDILEPVMKVSMVSEPKREEIAQQDEKEIWIPDKTVQKTEQVEKVVEKTEQPVFEKSDEIKKIDQGTIQPMRALKDIEPIDIKISPTVKEEPIIKIEDKTSSHELDIMDRLLALDEEQKPTTIVSAEDSIETTINTTTVTELEFNKKDEEEMLQAPKQQDSAELEEWLEELL